MDTQPIRDLLKAIELSKSGNKEEALAHLSQACGADEPTEYMKQNIDKLLEEPNDAILTLVIGETQK